MYTIVPCTAVAWGPKKLLAAKIGPRRFRITVDGSIAQSEVDYIRIVQSDQLPLVFCLRLQALRFQPLLFDLCGKAAF